MRYYQLLFDLFLGANIQHENAFVKSFLLNFFTKIFGKKSKYLTINKLAHAKFFVHLHSLISAHRSLDTGCFDD